MKRIKKTLIKKIIHTTRFKFAFLLGSSIFLFFCFHITLSRFNSTDPEPVIQNIDVELTKKFAAFTVHVETGLYIRSFPHFSMIDNQFTADMIVWFMFDPTEITLDIIEKFSFENGTIIKKSPPDIKTYDTKTFVKYDVIVELKSNLEFYRFPLEDHKLSIILTNHFVTPYEVMFEVLTTDFVVAPNLFIANWRIKNLTTNFGIDENILNQIDLTKKIAYPKATFIIDLVKSGIRKAFIIFTPIFIIFFLALFSFFLTLGNVIGRATLSVSALTALLGYRFVIEGLMPKVGYFTTTDYIYIILLIFSFIIFVSQMLITKFYNTAKRIRGDTQQLFDRYSLMKDILFIIISFLSSLILGIAIVL